MRKLRYQFEDLVVLEQLNWKVVSRVPRSL